MKTYFCKLMAPRASFLRDMSADEGQLMQQHAVYWREHLARGNVVAFGLVADPAAAYGVGIVEFEDDAGVQVFTDGDPTIRSGLGFRFEVQPMPFGSVSRQGAA